MELRGSRHAEEDDAIEIPDRQRRRLRREPRHQRGILEAHENGILTSTSLLVDTPWAEEAAKLGRIAPEMSVGLHAHLDGHAESDRG